MLWCHTKLQVSLINLYLRIGEEDTTEFIRIVDFPRSRVRNEKKPQRNLGISDNHGALIGDGIYIEKCIG